MMAANQARTRPILIDGKTVGVCLAPDMVGQHQAGIDRLLRNIGADPSPDQGVRSFREHAATRIPRWNRQDIEHEEKLHTGTGLRPRKLRSESSTLSVEASIEHALQESRRYSPDSTVTGAWDDSSFAVRGYGAEGRAIVDLLQKGVEDTDLVVWLAGTADFEYGGLCIARLSLIPEHVISTYDIKVADQRRLVRAAEDTGIRSRIDRATRPTYGFALSRYYALSPAWIDKEREQRSSHPVQFFLNPSDSENNNFGWFTVEELDEWLEGRGPVRKNPKE